jgi:hypothetical protein
MITQKLKWHKFVKHLVEERFNIGTLFPQISMEEQGEHSFGVEGILNSLRMNHIRGIYEIPRIVEHYQEVVDFFYRLRGDRSTQSTHTLPLIKKSPFKRLLVPPCVWNLSQPLQQAFFQAVNFILLNMPEVDIKCSRCKMLFLFNWKTLEQELYCICWCQGISHKSLTEKEDEWINVSTIEELNLF